MLAVSYVHNLRMASQFSDVNCFWQSLPKEYHKLGILNKTSNKILSSYVSCYDPNSLNVWFLVLDYVLTKRLLIKGSFSSGVVSIKENAVSSTATFLEYFTFSKVFRIKHPILIFHYLMFYRTGKYLSCSCFLCKVATQHLQIY